MTLQSTYSGDLQKSALENAIASGWHLACHITYNRDTWVKLLELPSEFASDEALLLCENSENTWYAWVPNHGQAILDKSNFYC